MKFSSGVAKRSASFGLIVSVEILNDVLGTVIGRSYKNVEETAMCDIYLNEPVCLEDYVFDSDSDEHDDNVKTYIDRTVNGEAGGLDGGEHVQVIADESVVGRGHVTTVKLIDRVPQSGFANDNAVTSGSLAVRDDIVSGDVGSVCEDDEDTSSGESEDESSSDNDNRRTCFKFVRFHRPYIDEDTYNMHFIRCKVDDELHVAEQAMKVAV